MIPPTLPSNLSTPSTLSRDVLWGRPVFRAPSLDQLIEMLDFGSLGIDLPRVPQFSAKEAPAGAPRESRE